jgi:hypothetical protein
MHRLAFQIAMIAELMDNPSQEMGRSAIAENQGVPRST